MKVIVIGGGPAGSLAATLLARRGVTVMLIEQHRFPRDKVCGECLSALGREVLRRHGLEHALLADGRELTTARLFSRSSDVTLSLPRPMLGLSRARLDAALLDSATAAGAIVCQPARAERVDDRDTAASVAVRCLTSNTVGEHTADYALIADGRAKLTANRPLPTGELGVKAHFADVGADPAAITLYGGIGCYGGVAPIEGDRWNVAFSLPRDAVAAVGGDLDAWWQSALRASPAMRLHFQSAQRLGPWLACPLPRHSPMTEWPARLIPVGAAACAIEPVGGEGMGTALRSAELAAEALLNETTGRLADQYAALWARRGPLCKLGGRLLADADWSDALSLAAPPMLGRAALWLVGK